MLLQECYKCGLVAKADKEVMIPMTINENGNYKNVNFCKRCHESIVNDQNNSNLLLG